MTEYLKKNVWSDLFLVSKKQVVTLFVGGFKPFFSFHSPWWILWEHDSDCSVHDVGGFILLGLSASQWVCHCQPISFRCAGFLLLFLSRCVCVREHARMRARVRNRCVLITSALQPPHPHKGTYKIKCRSWSLSFQLLASFQLVHSRKKPRCAPAGRTERWWTGEGWMLREAAWCTGRGARGSWRWWSPCRTCWWPLACWSLFTFTGTSRSRSRSRWVHYYFNIPYPGSNICTSYLYKKHTHTHTFCHSLCSGTHELNGWWTECLETSALVSSCEWYWISDTQAYLLKLYQTSVFL